MYISLYLSINLVSTVWISNTFAFSGLRFEGVCDNFCPAFYYYTLSIWFALDWQTGLLLQTVSNVVEEKAKWIFNMLKGQCTVFYHYAFNSKLGFANLVYSCTPGFQ